MSAPERFETPESFYEHTDRPDGNSQLIYGDKGAPTHGHVVFDPYRNPVYVRDENGNVIADTNLDQQ